MRADQPTCGGLRQRPAYSKLSGMKLLQRCYEIKNKTKSVAALGRTITAMRQTGNRGRRNSGPIRPSLTENPPVETRKQLERASRQRSKRYCSSHPKLAA